MPSPASVLDLQRGVLGLSEAEAYAPPVDPGEAPVASAGLEADHHQGEAGVAFCSKPRRTCTRGGRVDGARPGPLDLYRQGERP